MTERSLFDPRVAEAMVLAAIMDAAVHDRACPTNEQLSEMLGGYALSAPPQIISRIERRGLIKVERYQRERRITILATGQSTAAVKTPALHWRDRPVDVPAPPPHAVRARRPDTARDIMAAAQRHGRMPADFLADLVWIGWTQWQQGAIQLLPDEGTVKP